MFRVLWQARGSWSCLLAATVPGREALGPPAPPVRHLPAEQEALWPSAPPSARVSSSLFSNSRKKGVDSSERPVFKLSPSGLRKGFEGVQPPRLMGRVASCVPQLPAPSASRWWSLPPRLFCSGLECRGERLLLWLSWLEAAGCGGAARRGSSRCCAEGLVPGRQRLTWRRAGTSGPASSSHPFSALTCSLFPAVLAWEAHRVRAA